MVPSNGFTQAVREAFMAGFFYPNDRSRLVETIDRWLDQIEDAGLTGVPKGLVCPHAGYVFSGKVAAHGFKTLVDHSYEVVAVLAPSHVEAFQGASVYNGKAYATPLGQVPVAQDLAARIVKESRFLFTSEHGHRLSPGFRQEHAVEVQLPFLQRCLGVFQLLPIVVGDLRLETLKDLGQVLGKHLREQASLVVASSDLSHFYSASQAEQFDRKTLQDIAAFQPEAFYRNICSGEAQACGAGPIFATMIAAREMGANQATILHYAHSGMISGDNDAVVGYGAGVFYQAVSTAG